ncbi:hypothetical protein [Sphingomonas ursincola]|uniref:hypothetical protein n=1 Tax=Sphingomonas ursincola TaxID=56361 RepID=UPI002354F451|nr:hypothetical protein [Sphingomonas ursincola]
MASRALGQDSARSNVIPLRPAAPSLPRVPRFDPSNPQHVQFWEACWDVAFNMGDIYRPRIERQVERGIALLDAIDGDPDLEDGDEDGCPAYDDHGGAPLIGRFATFGPGDPDDAEDDDASPANFVAN